MSLVSADFECREVSNSRVGLDLCDQIWEPVTVDQPVDLSVDLWGRLSNPFEIAETVAAQASQPIGGTREGVGRARNERFEEPAEGPQEETGRLSNPPQRRLSATDIDDLVAAYRSGATINQLAAEFGIHRTTVAAHLDHHGVPRHHERRAWDDNTLSEAAEVYATGLALADVASQFGVDAKTVANRFRIAGIRTRPRRGWPPSPQ